MQILSEVKYLCHRAAVETKNVSQKTPSAKRNQRKIIRKWIFLWAQLKDYFNFANVVSLAGIADGEEQLPPEGNSEHVHLDSHSAEVSQAKRQPVVFSNKNHVEQLSLREKKMFQHLVLQSIVKKVGLTPKSRVSGVCSVRVFQSCRVEY